MFSLIECFFFSPFSLCSSAYWVTQLKPRRVLDLLDGRGYKLVGTTGIGQTYVATLYKEEEDKDKKN